MRTLVGAILLAASAAVAQSSSCYVNGASIIGQLWPLPEVCSSGFQSATLPASASQFAFTAPGVNSATLTAAFGRYLALLYPSSGVRSMDAVSPLAPAASMTLGGLVVQVADGGSTALDIGVSEHYTLNVQIQGPGVANATLQADTVWAALRGLETFVQLVQLSTDGSNTLTVVGIPIYIDDAPRFPYRGIMIDTARHFLPIATMERVVDAMAASKLNVLHVHLTDAQSFPVVVPAFPQLSTGGAYSAAETFSIADLQGLVAYANARGVVVVPEIDVPGHAYAWGLGFYNITAHCPSYAANINNIPLNPANEFTWDVLTATLSAVASAIPSGYLHIGGDEVVYGCWQQDPTIQQFMASKGWSNYNQLMQYFITRAQSIVTGLGRRPIQWNDVWDSSITVDPKTIFEVWRGNSRVDLAAMLNAGYNAVLSNEDRWYLNCGFNPICAYISWQNVYTNEPFANMTVGPTAAKNLLGGEATMWAEYADATNLEAQLWPRGAAVAERLWSPELINDTTAAAPRLAAHRCRLVQRGFSASPIGPGFCNPQYI